MRDTNPLSPPQQPRAVQSLAAAKLFKRLARGGVLERAGAVWRLGRHVVPDAVVRELQSADLLAAQGDRLQLSGPGAALAQRQAAADANDPYAGQNRLIVSRPRKIDGSVAQVACNVADNPLAWLARRNLLTARQLAAGDRLRDDYHLSQQAPRITMNWAAPPLGRTARSAPAGLDPTQAQVAARRRFEAAVAAAGPGLRDILLRVVCAGEGLETAEKALAWPARAAKLVLGFGLERLADHYALPDQPQDIL